MSPKYILVLLLAVAFTASSFAYYPKPPIKGRPTEELFLQEQEKYSHVNHHGPSDGGGHQKRPTKELSLQEQQNSQVNNYPYKPRVPPHPKQDNSQVNIYPRKPPHGPPHKPTTEELSLQEQQNSQVNNYAHIITPRKPPHGPSHKPTTEELSLQEQENTKKNPDPGHTRVVKDKVEEDSIPLPPAPQIDN